MSNKETWSMISVMLVLLLAGMMVLGGCVTLHERMCKATVTHYEKAPQASEADVYYGHYRESCYEEAV